MKKVSDEDMAFLDRISAAREVYRGTRRDATIRANIMIQNEVDIALSVMDTHVKIARDRGIAVNAICEFGLHTSNTGTMYESLKRTESVAVVQPPILLVEAELAPIPTSGVTYEWDADGGVLTVILANRILREALAASHWQEDVIDEGIDRAYYAVKDGRLVAQTRTWMPAPYLKDHPVAKWMENRERREAALAWLNATEAA